MIKDFLKKVCKREVVLLSATFLFGIAISSCKKVESNLGKDVQNANDELGLIKTDTFQIITYSKKRDSVRSDEEVNSSVMLGSYVDPVFGKVDAGFAGQYRLSGVNPVFGDLGTDLVVDSFVLSLQYNSDFYGTLEPQNVHVYQLTESIQKDSNYYNFSTPLFDPTDIVETGKNQFTPNPLDSVLVGTDKEIAQLRIPLDKTIAENLVNNAASIMGSDQDFVDAFPGLYVKVDNPGQAQGEGAVFSFQGLGGTTKSRLTIYFTKLPSNEPEEFSFLMNSASGYFSKIDFDHSGTVVGAQVDADSTLGMTEFYGQSGIIEPRVFLPTVTDLIGKKVAINKGELILPIQYFSGAPETPSATVNSYVVANNSDEVTPVDLNINLNTEKWEYNVDVTRLLLFIQNEDRENENILVLPGNFSTSVDRIVFNGANSFLKKKPKLVVTYTEY